MEGEYSGNCNFEGSISKKKKINHGKGDLLQITLDRIGDLPDSLLIQILSFLDTKDAFKTCILSKRWKNVWTHVEKLAFEYELEEYSREHVENFISFVDHTLLHCASTNLKKFLLYADHDYLCPAGCTFAHNIVDRWLQCISKKNVECFELLISSLTYSPPEWFYHKSSFVKLKILDWEIKILGQSVSWPSLKILVLYHVKIDDEEIAKILSGCPILEDLSLSQVNCVTSLNIMSRSVKKLEIDQLGGYGDLLDLNAPWLQELEISGDFDSDLPRFTNVSSLITAKIELDRCMRFTNDQDLVLDMACQLLESIHHVKELTLTQLFFQAFSIAKRLGRPSPLFMCKHMTVHFYAWSYDIPGIVCVLQSSPDLENLVIVVHSFSLVYFEKIFDELPDMELSVIQTMRNTLTLKNVKLIYHNFCFREELQKAAEMLPEMALVEYLFHKAPFMEKLVFSTQTENCDKCATNCASYFLSLFSSNFFRLRAEKNDSSEWQVRKKCLTLEISRI